MLPTLLVSLVFGFILFKLGALTVAFAVLATAFKMAVIVIIVLTLVLMLKWYRG